MIFKVHVRATQRTDSFLVDVQDVSEGKFTWQVERAYDDFKHLKSAMKDKFADSNGTWKSIALFPTPESLGNFLLSVLSYFDESIWSYEPILNFLDNSPNESFISKLKILNLTKKVLFLEKKSLELERSQECLMQNFKAFQSKIDQYLKAAHEPGSDHSQTGTITGPRLSWEIKGAGISPHRLQDPHLSINSLATTDSGISAGDNEHAIDSLLQDGEAFDGDEDLIGGSRLSGTASSRETSMPNSIYLPAELLPLVGNASSSHPFDGFVDSTLQNIAPVELQIQHRHSIVLLLKKLVRVALGSTAFEYGVQTTRCLLPDDPLKITVMLSKTLLPTWHTFLCEYLTSYAEKANVYGGSSFVPPDEDEQNLDPYFHDLAPTANHFIGNVSHVKQNLMHSVTMIVDSITVEISPNNRAELCLTSFVEEVNQTIGSNELFKRSLLLIRAWWALETQPYVGCSIRHYLSDFHLFVMLAGVFNQYSKYIKTPMVAFCFFLAEYSSFDGISKAISIRGFAPFQTKTSNQPILPEQKAHHIIPEALLEKYWVLYNISHVQEQQEQQQRKRGLSSDDEPSNSESGSSPVSRSHSITQTNELTTAAAAAAATSSAAPVGEISSIEKLLTDTVRENMKALSANHLFLFDRSSYNIIHPLSHTNMITEKLSQRRVSRLSKAFQSGAVAVAAILRGASSSDSSDSMKACFSNIRSFNNLWNQSQLPVDISHILKNPFELTKMMQIIQYSNLMIESAVNDDGLLILAQEILAVKGPLPVGEIGKILAETTSIPNLSTKLKERYGGLKKFLEAYQDRLVISNDHPFNPNVILRCSLLPEHLEMIEKGNFPHHIVTRAKKASAAASARRKKSHPSLNVPLANIDPASFTTNLPAMSSSPPPPPIATYRSTSTSQQSVQQQQTSPLQQQQQQMQSSAAHLSSLTPQQQNLVHATSQKLKNAPHSANATSSASAISASGMPLSVAQLAQQYGGSGSGNNRPKAFVPPGSVKLPLAVNAVTSAINNSNLLSNVGASSTNYFGPSNVAFADDNSGGFYPSPPHPGRSVASTYGNAGNAGMPGGGATMRLGSNPYSNHHLQQQQQQRLSGGAAHGVDISAFANAAAAHWSQQTSRRSSQNSDYGDLSSIGNTSTSGNNSNSNSLNLSSVGDNRDNVRNLFSPSPNSFASNHNKSSSYFGDSGGGNSLSSYLAVSNTASNSIGLNAPGVVGGSNSSSRPTSLGLESSTASNPSTSFGFGLDVGHQHDVSKLGLELDVLALTGSSNVNSSSATSNVSGHSNSGHGHASQNYNLW
jgi:hypothetical protein